MTCDSPYYVNNPTPWDGRDKIPVPCGRCPPCKERRVKEWSYRIEKEEEHCSSSFFVTLTYDTQHVPISQKGFMTLKKSDLTLFFKRLRKNTGYKFKYYAVGEYGTKKFRPHYHIIMLFSEKLNDITLLQHLQKSWTLGGHDVGTCTAASIRYTLKYVSKPTRIPQHKNDDRQKEYNVQSKHLGHSYITPQTLRYHHDDLENNFITHRGYKIPMPKSIRNKILSPQQKEQQRKIITSAIEETEAEKQADYYRKNPNGDYTVHLASQRAQRHHNFYNSKTQRNETF